MDFCTFFQFLIKTGFVVLETGGPYCPVYSFLCRGNGGSYFLGISVKGIVVQISCILLSLSLEQ